MIKLKLDENFSPSTAEIFRNPAFKNIQKLAVSLRNGAVSNGKKLSELLKVLPFTLGKLIQQIAAEPDEKTLDYYRELKHEQTSISFIKTKAKNMNGITCIWVQG